MTICDGCDDISDSVTIVKISSPSSRKGKIMEKKPQVPISRDLLMALFQYHLIGNTGYLPEIEKALNEKLDSMVKRQLYTAYKTAATEEEREKARLKYLDMKGVTESFRW